MTSLCLALPNDKILHLSELKAFAEDKSSVTQKLGICFGKGRKPWEKEKMLVTSIFSFSYNVFKSFPSQGH